MTNNPFMRKPGSPSTPGRPGMPPAGPRPGVSPNPIAAKPGMPPAGPKPTIAPPKPQPQAPAPVQVEEEDVLIITEDTPLVPVEKTDSADVLSMITGQPVVTEEPVAEATVEEVTEPTTTEEPVTEEAPKKKKATKKKPAAKEENATSDESAEAVKVINTLMSMPKSTLGFNDVCKTILHSFEDEEWIKYKNELIEECDSIEILSDMQEGALKKVVSNLARLRDRVWVTYMDTKVKFEQLSNKDTEGLIERVKFSNYEGANDSSRKANAVQAVMCYSTPEGEVINLYEIYDTMKSRFYFLKGMMDTIGYKTNLCITVLGAIKSEKTSHGA